MRPFRPLLCRHEFYWSERHRADRCRRCGTVQATAEVAPSAGLASLLSDMSPGWTPPPAPRTDAVIDNWPEAKPLVAPGLDDGSLLDRLEALIAGGELSRAQTIDTLLAMIEDGQSSDPVVFGPNAAALFARLNAAR